MTVLGFSAAAEVIKGGMKGFFQIHRFVSTAVMLTTVGFAGWALELPQVLARQPDPVEPNQAIRFRPTRTADQQARQFLDQGIVKALAGDYQGAIQNYNQAIQLGSENATIYYNRGVAFYTLGNAEAALQDLNRAIQLDPSNAEAYGNRGAIRLEQQDRQGAVQDFQHAVKLFSQRGDTDAAQALQTWVQQTISESDR